jgi:hypothetical protein
LVYLWFIVGKEAATKPEAMSIFQTLFPDLFEGGVLGVQYDSGLMSDVYVERTSVGLTIEGPDALYFVREQCRAKGLDICSVRFSCIEEYRYFITMA